MTREQFEAMTDHEQRLTIVNQNWDSIQPTDGKNSYCLFETFGVSFKVDDLRIIYDVATMTLQQATASHARDTVEAVIAGFNSLPITEKAEWMERELSSMPDKERNQQPRMIGYWCFFPEYLIAIKTMRDNSGQIVFAEAARLSEAKQDAAVGMS